MKHPFKRRMQTAPGSCPADPWSYAHATRGSVVTWIVRRSGSCKTWTTSRWRAKHPRRGCILRHNYTVTRNALTKTPCGNPYAMSGTDIGDAAHRRGEERAFKSKV
eukprot:1448265-Rhodomonas_salina.2